MHSIPYSWNTHRTVGGAPGSGRDSLQAGGQWSAIYLDQGYLPPDSSLIDYYRWLYTAITRSTEQVYLVNWPIS